jgi:hypothetical protein
MSKLEKKQDNRTRMTDANARTRVIRKAKSKAKARPKAKAASTRAVSLKGKVIFVREPEPEPSYDSAYFDEDGQNKARAPPRDVVPVSQVHLSAQSLPRDQHHYNFDFAFVQPGQLTSKDQQLYYAWLQGKRKTNGLDKLGAPETYETMSTMEADMLLDIKEQSLASMPVNFKVNGVASEYILRAYFKNRPKYEPLERHLSGETLANKLNEDHHKEVWRVELENEGELLNRLIDITIKLENEGKDKAKQVADGKHYLSTWKVDPTVALKDMKYSEAQTSSRILSLANYLQHKFKVAVAQRIIFNVYRKLLPVVFEEGLGHTIRHPSTTRMLKTVRKNQSRTYMYSPLKLWIVSYLKALPHKVDESNLAGVQKLQVLEVKSQ